MDRKIDFCIGGMHRSGTSLMAKICERSGLYIGTDLDPNQESKTFLNINEWLLKSNGMSWYNPRLFHEIESDLIENSLINSYIQQQLQFSKYFRQYNRVRKQYIGSVFKDPRLTFTYKIWKQIYPKLKLVLVVRNGFDVANSLMIRNSKIIASYEKEGPRILNYFFAKRGAFYDTPFHNLEQNIELWALYVKRGIELQAEFPEDVFLVRYEDITNDSVMHNLSEFLGYDISISHIEIERSRMNGSLSRIQKDTEIYNKNSDLFRTFGYD